MLKVDPTLVPFQAEWLDNIGGMANAIFWLKKNWNSQLSAQGEWFRGDGERWFWNYSPIADCLLVQRSASRESYRIHSDLLLHIKDGNEEMADYYRPFINLNDIPNVIWLRTRTVEVVKVHHDNPPTSLKEMYKSLNWRLKNTPITQFPRLNLTYLLAPLNREREGDFPTLEQIKTYDALVTALKPLRGLAYVFRMDPPKEDLDAYRIFYTRLRAFNDSIDPELSNIESFYREIFGQMIEDVLAQTDDIFGA